MGYISNSNLINYLTLSTTQPHLLLTQCDINYDSNHHHQLTTGSSGEVGDQKTNLPSAASSRWNPTPEQITTLEEIYRRGTRTPTTEKIQQIASKLRKYGKIEGKNIFYWFQNHKARERLKRRRRCEGDDDVNNFRERLKDVKDSSSGGCLENCNKDSNINSNEDHGTREESERALDDGKDVTWRNLVTSLITQEPGEINIDENRHNVNGEVIEEEEETRDEMGTLNLFPVMENQEKSDRFAEKKHTKPNQMCCYYEFMPLKKT